MKRLLLAVAAVVLVSCTAAQIEVEKNYVNAEFEGGSYTVNVQANAAWNVVSDGKIAGLTISPSTGSGNGSFTVNVPANNTKEERQSTLDIKCDNGSSYATTQVIVFQDAFFASIDINKTSMIKSNAGVYLKQTVTSNFPWTVTVTPSEGVELSRTSAPKGENEIEIIFPANQTSEDIDYKVVYKTNCGIPELDAEKTVEVTVEAIKSIVYAGEEYDIAWMKDGKCWMTENLRYVPEGKEASANPADKSGVWYPYNSDGTNVDALTDKESVRKYGLLYSVETAFGIDGLTPENVHNFEGTRGICPEGWHIPTRAEYIALCGYSNKNESESAPVTDETAIFYDSEYKSGKITIFNEGGWNFSLVGSNNNGKYLANVIKSDNCDVEEFLGRPALTYYFSSTGYMGSSATAKPQVFAMMSTFSKNYMKGRATVAYCNSNIGGSVRCVKD